MDTDAQRHVDESRLFDKAGRGLGLGQSGLARAGSQGGSDVTNTPFSSACL